MQTINTSHTNDPNALLMLSGTDSGHNPHESQSNAVRFLGEYYSKAMTQCTKRISSAAKAIISTSQGRVNSINALVLVIAFIAGIQAQIITFTIDNNDTALDRVTNVIAFVGLILDITGTLTGLAHTFQLQKIIGGQTNILTVTSDFESDVKAITEWLARSQESEQDLRSRTIITTYPIDDTLKRATDTMQSLFIEDSKLKKLESLQNIFRLAERSLAIGQVGAQLPFMFLSNVISTTLGGEVAEFGGAPVQAMVWGSLCMVVSIVLVAARELHKETWIACVVAGCAVYAGSMVANIKQTVMDSFRNRRIWRTHTP